MNLELLSTVHLELIGAHGVSNPGAHWPGAATCVRAEHMPGLYKRAAAALRTWRRQVRDRRELSELDDRMLRDIGLTRDDVLGRGERRVGAW
jgi:uncharacterized protein YjiS (DUF1127 family)